MLIMDGWSSATSIVSLVCLVSPAGIHMESNTVLSYQPHLLGSPAQASYSTDRYLTDQTCSSVQDCGNFFPFTGYLDIDFVVEANAINLARSERAKFHAHH